VDVIGPFWCDMNNPSSFPLPFPDMCSFHHFSPLVYTVGLDKDYYQAFFWALIDLIVELLGLIIKPFDNQTES
jgi:hypothetical protein